jgi:hypothetical protein
MATAILFSSHHDYLMEKTMNPSQCHSLLRILIGAFALPLASFSQLSQAACDECGTVTDVKSVRIEGKASGVGAVAGGVAGGVLGHQVGGCRQPPSEVRLAALTLATRWKRNRSNEPSITLWWRWQVARAELSSFTLKPVTRSVTASWLETANWSVHSIAYFITC